MSRDLIIWGYFSIVIIGLVFAIYSNRRPTSFMPLNNLLDRILHKRATRFALLAIWWWLGLHYLGG